MSTVSCTYYSVVQCVYTHMCVYEYNVVHILRCRARILVSCSVCILTCMSVAHIYYSIMQCVYTHICVYEYSVVHIL